MGFCPRLAQKPLNHRGRPDGVGPERYRIGLIVLMLVAPFFVGTESRAAEAIWSTEFFNSRKSEWDQLTGATIRMEGRVSLAGGTQLRLSKCEVPFHASEALIRPLQGKKSVEITGRLKKENGKLQFEVDRIQVLPTDLEQYESRYAKLRNPKGPELYALGDWATERSRFYEDADLAKKALSAYDRGVTADWRAQEADNANGRFQLAAKVVQYKLSEARRQELMHEGDRILWNAALKAKPAAKEAWTKLAAKLEQDFPDSEKALATFPDELKARYEREPLAVYRDSPETIRPQLHRIFYAAVLLKTIQDDAAQDGRNGDVIAERLERQVPEASQLAEQYRTLKMAWRRERSATATRPEIEQLAVDFRARKQPDQARLALTQWLKAQEPRLRQDGVLGLMQLADEYLALLQDERTAVAVLIEANKIDPAFADVLEKFKSLGYVNAGGTWIKANPATTPDPAATMDPVIPGTLAIGMNAVAARNAMGGRPGSLARVLTKKGATEVWSYGPSGTSRLVIRLEGTSLSPEVRVIEFRNER